MSEAMLAPTFTIPALQRAEEFGALERIVELMLEGRSAEVLCVVGGLAAGHMALGTAEDDDALLNELERHIWVRMENETPIVTGYLEAYRLHPMMVNVVEMLNEGAPIERLWALLTGLMIGVRSSHPHLHAMIMVNTLTHQVETARAKATASPN